MIEDDFDAIDDDDRLLDELGARSYSGGDALSGMLLSFAMTCDQPLPSGTAVRKRRSRRAFYVGSVTTAAFLASGAGVAAAVSSSLPNPGDILGGGLAGGSIVERVVAMVTGRTPAPSGGTQGGASVPNLDSATPTAGTTVVVPTEAPAAAATEQPGGLPGAEPAAPGAATQASGSPTAPMTAPTATPAPAGPVAGGAPVAPQQPSAPRPPAAAPAAPVKAGVPGAGTPGGPTGQASSTGRPTQPSPPAVGSGPGSAGGPAQPGIAPQGSAPSGKPVR
ncbi:MAG TPA: hypothetical protein P5181_14685 [Dermatophilaceae bacterium]|nr:hypothetical protein [Dermatophilaceae bacterium]